ncbi:MAG TPA: hypothetical protein VN704_08910 [Verrucomicrobiae bacterium]|nr:hypothetical protein [Verrucomicrobiae bacterium]
MVIDIIKSDSKISAAITIGKLFTDGTYDSKNILIYKETMGYCHA